MEYIIRTEVNLTGIQKFPVFCTERNTHLYVDVDMRKFANAKKITIDCPCGKESFVIGVRTVLSVKNASEKSQILLAICRHCLARFEDGTGELVEHLKTCREVPVKNSTSVPLQRTKQKTIMDAKEITNENS